MRSNSCQSLRRTLFSRAWRTRYSQWPKP